MFNYINVPKISFIFLVGFLLLLAQGRGDSYAGQLPTPTGPILLTITGKIDHKNTPEGAAFDKDMLVNLGTKIIKTHTPWSDVSYRFKGVKISDILEAVGASSGARFELSALNDYKVQIPPEDLISYEAILAFSRNNVPLTSRDRGPLWLVYPRDEIEELKHSRFDNFWVWQLLKIDVQ